MRDPVSLPALLERIDSLAEIATDTRDLALAALKRVDSQDAKMGALIEIATRIADHVSDIHEIVRRLAVAKDEHENRLRLVERRANGGSS